MKKNITSIELFGKKVIVRLDLNVPISNGKIMDDTRIITALDTIKYLKKKQARIIIVSHLGRPKSAYNKEYSLFPIKKYLEKVFQEKIVFAKDAVGADATVKSNNLNPGEILILENIRFDPRELECNNIFSEKLSKLAEYFIFDAFGVSHRKHASVYGISKHIEGAIGFLVKEEIEKYYKKIDNPSNPFLIIIGGRKVKDKLPIVKNLLDSADTIIIGGAMSYTFLKSKGFDVGGSIIEDEYIEECKNIISLAKEKKTKIILPLDHLCNKSTDSSKKPMIFSSVIPKEYMGLDVGPRTIKSYSSIIKTAKTIVWNGPLGMFENKLYSSGTFKTIKLVSKSKGFSYICGGDTAYAVNKSGYKKNIDYISTGGGAVLTLLKGEKLIGLENIGDES